MYSTKSDVAEGRASHTVNSRNPRMMIASLFAATATLARRPIAYFREDSATEERPQTHIRRFWNAARFLFLLAPATMIGCTLWVIWTQTANVPYWDEWETVLLDMRFKQGQMGFHDIVMLHAQAHRIILPRLIDLTLINLTNYNRQIELTFDLCIAILSASLLFWCLRRTMGSLTMALALLVPLSLLFFSFSQFADWYAPFQVQFILAVFGAACCMRGLTQTPASRKGFALTLAGAFIGSASSLHGLVTWIAFMPGIVRSGVRKTVVWIGCAVVVWVLYFQHFPFGQSHPTIQSDIIYSLAYLGAPLGYPDIKHAQIAGGASIVLMLGSIRFYLLRHKKLSSLWNIAPWLQLALFAFGCTQATAIGRSSSGPHEALSSRYMAFSSLWWIAMIVIVAVNIKELVSELDLLSWRKLVTLPRLTKLSIAGVNVAALLLITVLLLPVNRLSWHRGILWQETQRANQYAVVDYQKASDSCLELYYPWPYLMRPRAAFLQQQHLAIFSLGNVTQTPGTDPTGTCIKLYKIYIDDAAEGNAEQYLYLPREQPRALRSHPMVLDG